MSDIADDLNKAMDDAEALEDTTKGGEDTIAAAPKEDTVNAGEDTIAAVGDAVPGDSVDGGDNDADSVASGVAPVEETTVVATIKVAPKGWSAAAKAEYEKLPENIKREVHKREEDFFKGIEGYKARASAYDQIDQVVKPYEAMLRSANTQTPQAVATLLDWAYKLHTNPVNAVINLAQAHGIDLGALGDHVRGTAGGQQQVDPTVAALQAELAQIKGGLQAAYGQSQQQLQHQVANDVTTFATDTKNKYYENVKGRMADLLERGMAKDLPDAYEQACWMDPSVRAAMETDRLSSAEAERIKQAKQKADAAKRAGFGVSGNGVSSPKLKQDMNLRDLLEASIP